MTHVTVIFSNTTPLHSTQPGEAYASLDGQIFYNKKIGGSVFPLSRTRSMPIVTQDLGDDPIKYVPIMPANTMRHVLRENILQPITQSFIDKGASLSAGAYAAMWCGNASGRPAGEVATFAEVRAVQDHPFLGLFGGGPRMIEGKLAVDNAWAITPSALDLLPAVAESYVNPEKRLTTVQFKRRLDPLSNGVKIDIVERLLTAEEIAQHAQQELQAALEDKPAEGSDEKEHRGLKSFHAVEVVIPGVRWLWQIHSKMPLNEAQRAAVLFGVSALHGSRIGGLSSLDCGRILVKEVLLDGESVWDAAEGAVRSEVIEPFLAAIDAMHVQAFEAFAAQEEKANKGKKAKE